ncbi:YqaJ viral recombinase family protein [Cereibacter azotoformans]|uniref:YqaJ viral recombinase domain-containing protein n=1 Tax=Cereibacter sphaeroides (strain ATCC 17025 / ATH 2.4.3) TaxID=349102 RepID=A4WTJ6_CERS5|nr:lambda exonuclease family protein [Cereibacter azotoformans]ULB09959.1 YqaJ viral recombinase family protein [Cereibacter azotoformans]
MTYQLPTVEVFRHMEQGTPEWLAARAGVATASRFSDILTKARKAGEVKKTRLNYAYELAGEILTGEPAPSFSSSAMERGKMLEPIVRSEYEFVSGKSVEIGFLRAGRVGYSPDGLVGADGLLEIKTHQPKTLIGMLLEGGLPDEHKAQVQGGLWVSGREWLDYCGYWPGLPLHIVRVHRDEKFIEELAEAVGEFNDLVDDVVARVRAYGQAA